MTPFDQIYWNSGLGFADSGEYISSSAKVAKVGQTANRNPDSAFSFPGGNTTDQEVDEWFGDKASQEAVTNVYCGVHVTDPLTISPDKPYKGARLVLKRSMFWYHDPGGTCDNFTRSTALTQQFGFHHIKVKKNGVIQRPAEHGTLASASSATQTRFGDVDPKYSKHLGANTGGSTPLYSFDGTVGGTALTLYADYNDYTATPGGPPVWTAVPPYYIINKEFS